MPYFLFLGVARIGDGRRLAANKDRSGIALVGAGQNLDQRRLAGAVMADQPDYLAIVKVDRCPLDGVNAAERQRNIAHLDQWNASAVHSVLLMFCLEHDLIRNRFPLFGIMLYAAADK